MRMTIPLVTWSKMVHVAAQAGQQAAEQGIDMAVIDLRSLWPWDTEMVLDSVADSGRLLVVHEAVQVAGFGAEVAATVAEKTGAAVRRLAGPRIPVAYSPPLEDLFRIGADDIVQAARAMLT